MLYQKNNPQGIDFVIDGLQKKLYDKLMTKWGSVLYDCYGRCYRNRMEGTKGYVAEVYQGGDEYKEIYWDDTLDALSFFGISPVNKIEDTTTADVHLIFFANLAKLKPTITDRADEEVRIDVYSVIRKIIRGMQPITVSLGIENVLKEYSGSYTSDRLKLIDTHPVHVFRYDFEVRYNPLRCFSNILN